MSTFKKLCCALCVAGVGQVNAADSPVDIDFFGSIDIGVIYSSNTVGDKGNNFMVGNGMSASTYGVRGSTKLRDINAKFQIEGGYDSSSGDYKNSNGNLFGRQAWAALETPVGELKAGLVYSPFYLSHFVSDLRGSKGTATSINPYMKGTYGVGIFDDNAVVYTTPDLAGFKASAMYAAGESGGELGEGQRLSASATYSSGGLVGTAAYYQAKRPEDDLAGGGPGSTWLKGYNLAAAYRTGPLTITGGWTRYDLAESKSLYGEDNGFDVYTVGMQYRVSAPLFLQAQIYYSDGYGLMKEAESTLIGLGADYWFSAQTNVYVHVGMVDNDGGMGTGIFNNDSSTTTGMPDGMTSAFTTGVSFWF